MSLDGAQGAPQGPCRTRNPAVLSSFENPVKDFLSIFPGLARRVRGVVLKIGGNDVKPFTPVAARATASEAHRIYEDPPAPSRQRRQKDHVLGNLVGPCSDHCDENRS